MNFAFRQVIFINWVEPIRDLHIVESIAKDFKYSKSATGKRNYILWCIGIYCGLRVSDILRLKVRDVRNKDEINIIERKTGKRRFYPLPPPIKAVLNEYCRGKDKNDYLIAKLSCNSPIKRCQAYKIISDAATKYGLTSIGTHTMRKTFGYWFYKQTGDVSMLMTIFGHSCEAETLRYIGVTKSVIKEAVRNFRPFKI